jgi:thioester reductase-like protein
MPRPGYDAVLLVTGFPSLYARRMIEHTLDAEPRALIYVLTPPKKAADESATEEPATASERPVTASERPLAAFGHLPADQQDRIIFIEGEPAAMDLGLSGAEFRQLTSEVERIHHVAHVNHVDADRRAAHNLNVIGAAEILEFARATSTLECLIFHSTAHVSGDRTGVVYEDDLDMGQSFRSEVEQTRMRAEVLVRRAMRHAPIAVVRPTTLVGDTGIGENYRLDGLYLLVLLVLATPGEFAIPFPGRGDTPLNIVPLDYVVRAAHAIGRSPAAPGRTFHLADPNPLSARSVFDLVARAGGRRAMRSHIPSNLAKAVLRTPGIERFMRSPRAFVEHLTTQVRYETRNTEQILRGTDITCPSFESYVVDLVTVVQEHIKAQKRRRTMADEMEVDDPLS